MKFNYELLQHFIQYKIISVKKAHRNVPKIVYAPQK